MAAHIDTLQAYLSTFGNNNKIDEARLEQCLNEIKSVIEGSAKGRKASFSPSQTSLTPKQMWFILNGHEHDYNPDMFKPFSKLKMMFSSVCEHVLALMYAEAGVDIKAPKGKIRVTIETPDGHVIDMSGSDDYRIDGEIIDCKMPNETMYKTKFKSAKYLSANDMFGYIPQAFLYSKGEGLPFKGWDVCCTSTGAVKHLDASKIDLEGGLDRFLLNYDSAMKAETADDAYCPYEYVEPKGLIPWQCSKCRFRDACWGASNLTRIEKPSGSLRHSYVPPNTANGDADT